MNNTFSPKILDKNSANGFNLLVGINRTVNPQQVTKLAGSINNMGVIRPIVIAILSFIDGVSKKYIIDGQHLYFALIRNNMDFPYITIKDKQELVEKIALLNSSSKSWSTVDYITAWASLKEDYKKLNSFRNTYDIEFGLIASIAHFGIVSSIKGGNNIYRAIKKGEFKVQDEEQTIDILNKITDVLKLIPRMDRESNNTFISAYVQFLKGFGPLYNHEKFLLFVSTHKKDFSLVTQDPNEFSKLLKKSLK